MQKRILPFIISLVLVIALIFGYIHFHTIKNYKNNYAIKAIPVDAGIIIQLNKPHQLIDIIHNEIKFKKELEQFSWFNSFNKGIHKIDSSATYNQTVIQNLINKSLTVSLHPEGKDKVQPLFLYELDNKAEQNKIESFLQENPPKNWIIKERKYNSTTIHSLIIQNSAEVYIAIKNGILMASYSPILIENSIRQLRSNFSLITSDTTFGKIYKTAGNNCDANIFVNFNLITNIIKPMFDASFNNELMFFNRVAKWGEFDINLSKDDISANGFLYSDEGMYINTFFNNISSSSSSITKYIPSNPNFFASYSFNDTHQLRSNLHEYLKVSKKMVSYRKEIEKLNLPISGNDAEKLVFELIDEEFALVQTNNSNTADNNEGKLFIIKTHSKSKTEKAIKLLNNDKKLIPAYNYQLDKDSSFPIYKSKNLKIFQVILGHICPNSPEQYFTLYNNILVFSNSINTLKSYIYANALKKTIHNSKYFQEFTENFSYKENTFVYCDISKLNSIFPKASSSDLFNPNEIQLNALSKFYGIGIQITKANHLLYTNICLKYIPQRDKEPRTIWQSRLDSSLITKPTLVKNHYTKEKEIIVQDKANNLYLIANNGVILWKKKLDSPILSQIYQIDYYKNNKLQYLFNTKNSIFLLDRNGNHVEKYPINLSHEATNGLSLFEYDNTKNYRIFIACNDYKTYAYEKTGKIINGWKAKKTEGIVTKPIQHFRIKDKDYIVFSDNKRNYILNRRGDSRVNINPNFVSNSLSLFYTSAKSNSILYTTDTKGNLRSIDLNSGITKLVDLLNEDETHYFIMNNITSHDGGEFVLLTSNELKLYSESGKVLFEKDFDSNIYPTVDLYHFSTGNKKLGVFDSFNNQIYLVNNDGSTYKNFPLKGSSRFSIGFMNKNQNNFNLIVGGDNNYLYNYRVE
jgi:hypothetical protein